MFIYAVQLHVLFAERYFAEEEPVQELLLGKVPFHVVTRQAREPKVGERTGPSSGARNQMFDRELVAFPPTVPAPLSVTSD